MPEPLPLILNTLWQIFEAWWWLPLPFLLWGPFLNNYLYWLQEKWYDKNVKSIILEIKMPKEVIKPIRAMDQIFANFHGIHDVVGPREKWLEGVFQLKLSLEIVSLGGEIHFYIRAPETFRNIIESNIYSQYPEVEISLVDDYTKYVPQDIPNKDWDIWGVDYINAKDEIYPLKTYLKFETEKETKEEKRLDPLTGLLEGMASLKPGEQFWFQLIARPVLDRDNPWRKRGRELADKIARRPAKAKPKSIIREAMEILISGKPDGAETSKEKEIIPPEMKLTPGEKEILAAVEEKMAKFGYSCHCRFVYLGKRDVFFKPRTKIGYGFFKEISTENLGGLKPWAYTMTRVKSIPFWFLDKRRLYLKQRRMFRYYCKRFSPLFPRAGGTFVLNTEELATLYHFPGRIVVPASDIPRIEAKKGGPPPGLPVE